MKKVLFASVACILIFAACNKTSNQNEINANSVDDASAQLQTPQQINSFINQVLNSKEEFDWSDASDITLCSAVFYSSDHMVSVGYKPANETNVEERLSKINIHDNKWTSAKAQVIQLILEAERTVHPNLKAEDVEVWKENKLPVIDVKIDNINTIKLLRHNKLIRYVEPMSYEPENYDAVLHDQLEQSLTSGIGCGGYVGNPNLKEGTDYTNILPNAKQSWNYLYHNIPAAWRASTGAGIKIMVIDTGVSPDQDNMNSQFNQGYSSGRTLQKIFTLPGATSADDDCGHGTTMSSTATAPRCTDGNSCGVAYNSSLVICKAVTDVIIDNGAEVKGVSDAFTYAADDTSIKITSMSVGRITGSSQIKDAINYAYGKGKLMFCAGGTSTDFTSFLGVVFPATLPQVEAITGVKNTSTLKACGDCHKGSQIDFVVVMERTSDKGNPICNAISGDVPSTVGGSSVATSTSAGIAALVWSAHPTETREQILNRLTTTASSYPTKNKSYGYGKLNASAAISQ
ncbi:MAG: S8/S53 family peptidase [Parafilimonas sp.]